MNIIISKIRQFWCEYMVDFCRYGHIDYFRHGQIIKINILF